MVVEMVPNEQLLEQRLDGLEKKVDDGFGAVDRRFREMDKKVDDGFKAVDKRFERVEGRLSESNGHLLALHRLLIRVSIGGAVAISLSLLGIIAQLAITLS
jgi:tetrahydromethanopterin S-methyltransferase subunit G